MAEGLKVTYLWHDNDVLEVRLAAQNIEFRGTADVYIGTSGLGEIAAQLSGFPTSNTDRRVVALGAAGRGTAGGYAMLQFYCTDSAGHAECRATIEADHGNASVTQSAIVQVRFEPAGLDAFLVQLRRVEKEHSGSASLPTVL